MKKTIAFIIPFMLLIGASWFGYNYYYGGKDYYTKIETTGDMKTDVSPSGEQYTVYTYSQTAFDKQGEKTMQKLHENRVKPLRMGAYLKLKVNPRKGVLSWEEVKEKEVPEKALNKINS